MDKRSSLWIKKINKKTECFTWFFLMIVFGFIASVLLASGNTIMGLLALILVFQTGHDATNSSNNFICMTYLKSIRRKLNLPDKLTIEELEGLE
jgi:hypothetical protein